MEQMATLLEQTLPQLPSNRAKRLVGNQLPFRYICPHCNKRYGVADACGWIDLRRCTTCPKFSMMEL